MTRWLARRLLRREVDRLREDLEAKEYEMQVRPDPTPEGWLKGAGVAFALGFVDGLAAAKPSPRLDGGDVRHLLVEGAATALTRLAAYVRAEGQRGGVRVEV
jgi:hypothetical protein